MNFYPEIFYKKTVEIFEKKYQNVVIGREPKSLYQPCDYIIKSNGKRLRPFLVILSAKAVGGRANQVMNAAVAVELFHNFTLVHDDIMDNAKMRRGRKTLHLKYDESTAILAGDNLLAIGYQSLLIDAKNNIKAIGDYTKGLIEVCEGQSLDKEFESRKNVSIDEYLKMIQKKTAALSETCCSIGANLGGGSAKEVNTLRRYGKYLGLAFQIQDDILDIMAEQAELGKMIGGDLVEGKKTFLLLKALEIAKGNNKKLIKKVIDNGGIRKNEIGKYKELFIKLGIIDYAQEEVNRYTNLALKQTKDIKNKEAKLSLQWLANKLTYRRK